MAKVALRIHTAKYGAITATGNVDAVSDLPRLFARATQAIKQAGAVLPDVAGAKVERISFGDAEGGRSRARKPHGEAAAATA